ncbi:MAG TPA: hypothetical protein DIU37_00380 [Opitutae bacterium]|nr:hypothetical protein [Opitutae bacterium]
MASPEFEVRDKFKAAISEIEQKKVAKFERHEVELDSAKSTKSWASTFVMPFVGFKHLCQRLTDAFHGNMENVVRQCHRDLLSGDLASSSKNTILTTIREISPDDANKHAVAQALLSIACDKHVDPDVRFEAACRVHQLEPTQGNRNKLVKSILSIVGNPAADLNTRVLATEWLLSSTVLTSQSSSRQCQVLESLAHSVVKGGGVSKETFKGILDALINKGYKNTAFNVSLRYARCSEVSAQDRLNVLAYGFSQLKDKGPFTVQYSLQDALSAYECLLEDLSPEERHSFIREHLIPVAGTFGRDSMHGYFSKHPKLAQLLASDVNTIVKEDQNFAASNVLALNSIMRSTATPVQRLAFCCAMVKNDHIPLAFRLIFEDAISRHLASVDRAKDKHSIEFKAGDGFKEAKRIQFEKPVLTAIKIKLFNGSIPIDERLQLMGDLDQTKRSWSISTQLRESLSNARAKFIPIAVREGLKKDPYGVMHALGNDPIAMLAVAKNEDAPLLLRYQAARKVLNVGGRQLAREIALDIIENPDIPFGERMYVAGKELDTLSSESSRRTVFVDALKSMASDTSLSFNERFEVFLFLKDKRHNVDDLLKQMILDPTSSAQEKVIFYLNVSKSSEKKDCRDAIVDCILNGESAASGKLRLALFALDSPGFKLSQGERDKIMNWVKVVRADESNSDYERAYAALLVDKFGSKPLGDEYVASSMQFLMDFASNVDVPKSERYEAFLLMLTKKNKLTLEDQKKLLEVGCSLIKDPSQLGLPVRYVMSTLDYVRSSLLNICRELNVSKDDALYKQVNQSLNFRDPKVASLLVKRARGVVHNPPVAHFYEEDVGEMHVRWNPAVLSKKLNRPEVPNVDYNDFKSLMDQYAAEVHKSPQAKQEAKLLSGTSDIDYLIGDSRRKEFSEYLAEDRVSGVIVDPVALSLRRVVERAMSLSDLPEEGERLSPRSKLIQQLLVNCRTCVTGFADGVQSTERNMPGAAKNLALGEDEMREERARDAFKNEYLAESVKRRQALLDGESNLAKDAANLSRKTRVSQPVHQTWAMDMSLGHLIGVHTEDHAVWVDPYLFCVYPELLSRDPQTMLDGFYHYYTVDREVAHFKEFWNQQIAEDAQLARDKASGQRKDERGHGIQECLNAILGSDIGDAYEYDDDFIPVGLSDYGAALVLVKLGFLEEVPQTES